jgi:hypothetical protein
MSQSYDFWIYNYNASAVTKKVTGLKLHELLFFENFGTFCRFISDIKRTKVLKIQAWQDRGADSTASSHNIAFENYLRIEIVRMKA